MTEHTLCDYFMDVNMKTGIGIDYSNICKDYNTAYLDRDNKDPETSRCMKAVTAWTKDFLSAYLEEFGYSLYHLSSDTLVKVDDVAANRFLFYSLEKGITLQSFVVAEAYSEYANAPEWVEKSTGGTLIQNDEDGEGIYLFVEKDSNEHQWITKRLEGFSLDDAPVPSK